MEINPFVPSNKVTRAWHSQKRAAYQVNGETQKRQMVGIIQTRLRNQN